MPTRIKVDLPKYWSVYVDDYHGFDDYESAYSKIMRTHHEEVGCNTIYEAVFWIGPKTPEVKSYIQSRKQVYDESYVN